MKSQVAVDRDLQQRCDDILQQMSAREAPRVLYLIVVIIVGFDVAYLLAGIEFGASYLISDAVQSVYMLITAILIQRGVIPVKWAPAAFCAAVVVNNLAVSYQYTLVGISAVGVIYLFMASYGAITLMWRPFLISAVIMSLVTGYVLMANDPVNGPGWIITAETALAVSAVILYGRRQGGMRLAEANRTIERFATIDVLTGLLNRRGLDQALPMLTSHAKRGEGVVFAVFVDVNDLKAVNDTHGHLLGDTVIKRTADALKRSSRETDLVCRWGGDEFIVIGIGSSPDPGSFEESVRCAVDVTDIEHAWTPRVGVGVASASAHEFHPDTLISRADHHMYARRSAARRPSSTE